MRTWAEVAMALGSTPESVCRTGQRALGKLKRAGKLKDLFLISMLVMAQKQLEKEKQDALSD
jgi:hypothetical protein